MKQFTNLYNGKESDDKNFFYNLQIGTIDLHFICFLRNFLCGNDSRLYEHECSVCQWSGSILGIVGWDCSVCKFIQLHVDILRFSFMRLGYILYIPLQRLVNFLAILNFNRFFLKLNRFICNWLFVLPDHRCMQLKTLSTWMCVFN